MLLLDGILGRLLQLLGGLALGGSPVELLLERLLIVEQPLDVGLSDHELTPELFDDGGIGLRRRRRRVRFAVRLEQIPLRRHGDAEPVVQPDHLVVGGAELGAAAVEIGRRLGLGPTCPCDRLLLMTQVGLPLLEQRLGNLQVGVAAIVRRLGVLRLQSQQRGLLVQLGDPLLRLVR